MIAQNGCFDIRAIVDACDEVVNHDYVNEWYWKKTLKSKSLSVQVKILHEVEGVHLYWVFRDSLKNVQKEKLIISDIPDERVYDKYFGKLEWISDRTARLTAKTGEHYIAAYD